MQIDPSLKHSVISNRSDSQIEPLNLEGLSELWELTLGSSEITVAILDGPCDTTHPSLAQSTITQIDSLGIGSGTTNGPVIEHGTHIASIIFGQHNGRVKGIAPQCRGLIIPIFHNNPHGGISACSQPDLARAIRAAANGGASVINISAGQFSFTGTAHPMLADAIEECRREGRLIVSAAGNNGCSCSHIPGAIPSVLTVGAMDEDGNPMKFSNWGSHYQTSGILAPGVNILGALPGKRVGVRMGTSYATPIVSGVAALLLSLQKDREQELSAQVVRTALLESALGCEHNEIPDCRRLLGGRINVKGAISRIISLSRNNHGGKTMSDSSNVSDQAMGDSQSSLAVNAQSPQEIKAASSEDMAAVQGVNATSEAEVVAAKHKPQARNAGFSSAITASDCACEQDGEIIYVIGGLTIDYGTQARFDSLVQNAEGYRTGGRKLNLHDNADFLRHLLGWKEIYEGENKKPKEDYHPAHLYDAKDVIWVLTHDENPVYALQPKSTFAEEGYFELAHFLLETEGFDDAHEPVSKDHGPLNQFYHPSLDTDFQKGPNPNRRPKAIVERVAIAGKVTGTVRLMNGMEIPVVCPNQRGTKSWSLAALLKLYADPESDEAKNKYRLYLERLILRFREEARNPGISGEDRALNFACTHSFKIANEIQAFLRVNHEPDVDSITVEPSPTCRKDSECYDVRVRFFDAENILRANDVIRYTIDVSDEVPVLLGEPQHYRSRAN